MGSCCFQLGRRLKHDMWTQVHHYYHASLALISTDNATNHEGWSMQYRLRHASIKRQVHCSNTSRISVATAKADPGLGLGSGVKLPWFVPPLKIEGRACDN